MDTWIILKFLIIIFYQSLFYPCNPCIGLQSLILQRSSSIPPIHGLLHGLSILYFIYFKI